MWHNCYCLIAYMAYHICSTEVFSVFSHGTSRIVYNHHVSSMLVEVFCHECLTNHPSIRPVDHLQVCVSDGVSGCKKPAKVLPHVHYLLSLASGMMCMAKTHRAPSIHHYFIVTVFCCMMFICIFFHRHESLVALWLSDNAQNRSK